MRLGSEHEKHAKQQRHPGENVQRLGVAFVGVFQEKQMQQRECSCVAWKLRNVCVIVRTRTSSIAGVDCNDEPCNRRTNERLTLIDRRRQRYAMLPSWYPTTTLVRCQHYLVNALHHSPMHFRRQNKRKPLCLSLQQNTRVNNENSWCMIEQ